MYNKKLSFLTDNFLAQLKIINGIKFTHREVDIIAFLICGRAVKKIASFFSIAPKTVENHTHNIMVKLGCNSRESIIDFIEKSDRLLVLRQYYTTLLAQSSFEKVLGEIAQQLKGEPHSCILTYWKEKDSNLLIGQLEAALKFAEIDALVTPRVPYQSLKLHSNNSKLIYIVPKNHEGLPLNDQEKELISKYTGGVLLFLPRQEVPIEIFKNFEREDSSDYVLNNSYYFIIFEILKNILLTPHIEKIITDFEKQYEVIKNTLEQTKTPLALREGRKLTKDARLALLVFLLLMLGVVIIFCFGLKGKKGIEIFSQSYPPQQMKKTENLSIARSDLVIPTKSAFLDRPRLVSLLNERFKQWKGIQTIALVGIGGAGKTTIARQYAQQQNANIIWEFSSETKEILNESFQELADKLAETDQDQRILKGIISLEDVAKREDKVIQFVKQKLKSYQNWFLIYDNVERFKDIQNHFPKDPVSWGEGRVILTTQDNNIENNKYVHNIILINELSHEEKLNLFIKIMSNGESFLFTPLQIKEAKKFLEAIPPFPLDISVAAYYLKATNVPYQSYLEQMYKYDHSFSHVQERILQETGDNYTKTRYQIITVSLMQLIDKNEHFKDLLLFTCLLDPQNITRDLLLKCKTENIVDEFIYYLKKYSLIINKNMCLDSLNSLFTMHRSTQNIILMYTTNVLKLNEDEPLIQSLVKILEDDMGDAIEKEDFAKMKFLSRHVEHFLNQNNFLDNVKEASLSGELGCICYYLCHYSRAERLLNLGITALNNDPAKSSTKLAHFLVYLGNVHRRLGNYEKSQELFEKGIRLYKESAKLHTGMGRAYGYLGMTYESLGAFNKAKALLEKSLTIHQKCSKNQIGHAWSLAHLGSVYKNIGDYLKARELYQQALNIYKSFSPYHVGVAWVCKDLGFIHAKLGDKEEARKFLEDSLTIYRKHFFEDHIYIAHALINLGIFYRETKEFEKSKNLLKKGLAVVEKAYGRDHADTGTALKEIGKTFLAEGNLKIAEDMINQTHSVFAKIKHPDKYEALEILAEIYEKQSLTTADRGKALEAIQLKAQAQFYLAQALKIVKTYFPEDSSHNTRIQSKIGNKSKTSG